MNGLLFDMWKQVREMISFSVLYRYIILVRLNEEKDTNVTAINVVDKHDAIGIRY